MDKHIVPLIVSLLVMVFCVGCGDGDDQDDRESRFAWNLSGTWLGVVEDDTGGLHELTYQVDDWGSVVEVTIDNVATGTTGYIEDGRGETLFFKWI